MQYEITNTGEARTVDYLAVFAAGETRTFSEEEAQGFSAMYGVPLAPGTLPEQFEVTVITGTPEGVA